MPKPEPDWAAVAEAYARGEETVARIGLRLGVPLSTLYLRAKREGWRRPAEAIDAALRNKLPSVATLPMAERAPRRMQVRTGRKPLLERMFRSLEAKMKQIEADDARARDEGRSAAEAEGSARMLGALGRIYDKLSELERRMGQVAGSQELNDDDADRLRRDLAERLQRLQRRGDA